MFRNPGRNDVFVKLHTPCQEFYEDVWDEQWRLEGVCHVGEGLPVSHEFACGPSGFRAVGVDDRV